MALELEEPMTVRIGKRELLLDDEGIGRGTIIEQQLWRPLHRARVSAVEDQTGTLLSATGHSSARLWRQAFATRASRKCCRTPARGRRRRDSSPA
jgi:hypothetical protein